MAITTLIGAAAGASPIQRWWKNGGVVPTAVAIGRCHSLLYEVGNPAAAAAPSPGVNGEALTTYAGQLPFTNPASGNSYLSRFTTRASDYRTYILCDRLWQNSGLDVTSNSLQSITPAAIPARDSDGTTAGRGVYAALEVSTIMGAGTPTYTLTYTNSAGTGSKTAVIPAVAAAATVGTFYVWPLADGDVGVRSVQGFTASATSTSGAFHIVLFRYLVSVGNHADGATIGAPESGVDNLTGGFVRLYDDTVPFIIRQPSNTGSTSDDPSYGSFGYTQG